MKMGLKIRRIKLIRIIYVGTVYITGVLLLARYFKGSSVPQKNRYSDYFKANNEKRVIEAKSILTDMKTLHEKDKHNSNETGKFGNTNNESCQLSINIISMSRENYQTDSEQPHYLLQSVAALIDIITKLHHNKFQIHVSVCNVDLYPEKHIDMQYINGWLTVFQRDKEERKTYENRYEKETQDYVFCIKNVLLQNSSFILILEDDAIAHPDLFTVMEKELFEKEKCKLKSEKYNDAFYIKLHTNSWDLNFVRLWRWTKVLFVTGFDVEKMLELVLLTIILDVSIIKVCRKLTKMRFSYNAFIILFIYIAWLLNVIGRQKISTVWRYILGKTHEVSNAAAGSFVAVLYPRVSAEATVRYLSSFEYDRDSPKDIVVNQFARKHWKELLLIEPPLFTHIGYKSTKSLTT